MKDILRLRFYASHIGVLAAVAGISILLTTALRSAMVFQIKYVIGPALGEKDTRVPTPPPQTSGTRMQAQSRFPVVDWAKKAVQAAKSSWYQWFRVEEAKSDRALRRRLILSSCVVLLLLGLSSSLSEMVSVFVTQYLGFAVLRGVRQQLFEHLQGLPLAFFESRHSGDLIARISNDTAALQAAFGAQIASFLSGPITCVGMAVVMVWLNWRLALVIFLLMPAVTWCAAWLGIKLRKQHRAVQERMADLIAFSEETFGGIRVIQAFGIEQLVDELFERANRAVFRTSVRTARLRALNVPVANVITILGIVVALYIGGNEILAGRMGGSDLISFIAAMAYLGTGVARTTKLNLLIQQAAAPCSRIWEILDTPSDLTDAPGAVELTEVQGSISLRDVTFSYDSNSEPVLRNINLDIRPGEVVALAGPSGAGKTTLANLVPRLYDVTSGAVLIDGRDVRTVTRASLRRHMGIVPQETVLFATTIRENIAYGRPGASMEEIIAAAQAAQAHEFISALPAGYDTEIGQGGVKLSGGERQRIAIARALLRDPRILILDEATSSLDAESEGAVQAAINRLLEGRTALIIAHRLSTIRDADRIVVLDRGRIVEEGSHAELIAAGKLYRALYESQLQEEGTNTKPNGP